MAKEMYVGANNIARKLTKAYVGIDGVARKVTKAYVGDSDGIARLCWGGGVKNRFLMSAYRYDRNNSINTKSFLCYFNTETKTVDELCDVESTTVINSSIYAFDKWIYWSNIPYSTTRRPDVYYTSDGNNLTKSIDLYNVCINILNGKSLNTYIIRSLVYDKYNERIIMFFTVYAYNSSPAVFNCYMISYDGVIWDTPYVYTDNTMSIMSYMANSGSNASFIMIAKPSDGALYYYQPNTNDGRIYYAPSLDSTNVTTCDDYLGSGYADSNRPLFSMFFDNNDQLIVSGWGRSYVGSAHNNGLNQISLIDNGMDYNVLKFMYQYVSSSSPYHSQSGVRAHKNTIIPTASTNISWQSSAYNSTYVDLLTQLGVKNVYFVAYGNGMYLMSGGLQQSYNYCLLYSYDFVNWTVVELMPNGGSSNYMNIRNLRYQQDYYGYYSMS